MDWDWRDTGLLSSAIAGLYADRESTKAALKRPDRQETNAVLGTHPNDAKVDNYFGTTGLLTAGGALALPAEYRRPLLGLLSGTELALAHGNEQKDGKKDDLAKNSWILPLAGLGLGLLAIHHGGMSLGPTDDGGRGMKMTLKKEF